MSNRHGRAFVLHDDQDVSAPAFCITHKLPYPVPGRTVVRSVEVRVVELPAYREHRHLPVPGPVDLPRPVVGVVGSSPGQHPAETDAFRMPLVLRILLYPACSR